MIDITTYSDINGLRFGSDKSELLKKLGKGVSESKNRIGEIEIDFNEVVYRYTDAGFVEATFASTNNSVSINKEVVADVWEWIQDMDSECVMCSGFLVSGKYGLAIDDDVKYGWLSVFCKGRWNNQIAKGMRLTSRCRRSP